MLDNSNIWSIGSWALGEYYSGKFDGNHEELSYFNHIKINEVALCENQCFTDWNNVFPVTQSGE
jgi:hypothetical protein